jgi:GNAT superfamily N-acetyltransferase
MDAILDFAGPDDLDAMADLLAGLFAQEHDFAPDKCKQRAGLARILAEPARARLFVARQAGRVVAMTNIQIGISTAEGGEVMMIEDVIVAPALRGQGLGRALLRHVFDWGAGQGMTRATLLTDHDNLAAQAFYARMGFAPSAMRVLRRRLP